MTTELSYLAWSVVLLLVHISAQAMAKDLSVGFAYAWGPQDEERPLKGVLAGRVARALRNFLETYPAFASLALMLAVTGLSSSMTAMGAAVWFWARVAYLAVYAMGVPYLRTFCWFASIGGILLMLYPLIVS